MCVGFYTLDHPEYALILCSNRDEYLQRPTDLAHFHSFGMQEEHSLPEGNVLSGVDVRAGGTWLGINRTGRVAFLTNITEEYRTYGSSRGDLVASFLSSTSSRPFEEDVHSLIPCEAQYAGFNLLVLAPSAGHDEHNLSFDGAYVTNHGGGGTITVRPLTIAERRCGGMSNGIDGNGAEAWPKVQHGLHSFKSIISAISPNPPEKELAESLFQLLTWKSPQMPRARSELRNTIQVEPLSIPGSQDYYGTRLSTVILVKRNGEVLFIERDRWKIIDGKPVLSDPSSQREFRFELQ